MNITVIGIGYVGLVTAACLADFGHFVIGVDQDENKILKLQEGKIPIYEIGLEEIVRRNLKENRLTFTNEIGEGVWKSLVIIICVGTPPNDDGSVDLSQVKAVAQEIANHLNEYKVIVNKSTVPVGTGKMVSEIIRANLREPVEFDVASNPEFLREGSAVEDFMHPNRVVIGTDSPKAEAIMKDIYKNRYLIETPFVLTNLETAELIKYASNAFLATKISFINELANLCEAIGGDVQMVAKGMGLDGRINSKFLHAGPGFGGSCFPKDTRALVEIARSHGERVSIVEAVVEANTKQKQRMIGKIAKAVGDLTGKTIAILGLSFKPNTDDMRDAPSVTIIEGLIEKGARIRAHDPIAIPEAQKIFRDTITYYDDVYTTVTGADAVVIITEWNSFRRLDLARLKTLMKKPVLIDLRNVYSPMEAVNAGFRYEGVGKSKSI